MTYLLAIDPGSNLGWAVFNTKSKGLINHGLIDGGKHKELYDRINFVEDQVRVLFSQWRPGTLVIEGITAIAQPNKMANFWLNYTYGFAVSLSNRAEIKVVECNPSTLKKRVKDASIIPRTNLVAYGKNGQLNKFGMVASVNKLLGLKLRHVDHNIADAIALGLLVLELV